MTNQIKNKTNNITSLIYHKSDIVEYLSSFISSKYRHGHDIIVPQCFMFKSQTYSLLSKNIFKHFPVLQNNLEMFTHEYKNYGNTQFVVIENKHNKNLNKIIFANMLCAKYRTSNRKINYIALAKSMSQIASFISSTVSNTENDDIQISSSKFGTGFLGGHWPFIAQLINDSWPQYTTNIYTYDKTR